MLWAVEPRRVPVTLVVIDFAVRWVSAPRENLQLQSFGGFGRGSGGRGMGRWGDGEQGAYI